VREVVIEDPVIDSPIEEPHCDVRFIDDRSSG